MALLDARVTRRTCRGLGVGLAAWLLLLSDSVGQPAREYQIKAVFLFNFAQFVDWPPATFAAPESPIVIGVLGEDPFGGYLDEAVRDEKIGSRALLVRRFRRVDEVEGCQVLFISRSELSQLDQVFMRLRGRGILTVGDFEGFALRGGMIRLVTEKSKVRMRINPDAARQEGLTISSKLLRPAEIVAPGKD